MPGWKVHFDLVADLSRQGRREKIAAIRAVTQVLTAIPIPPHVRERLNNLNILRAVRGTTGIEGVELTEEEVADVVNSEPSAPVLPVGREREQTEVRNAYALIQRIQGLLTAEPDRPLTEELIREFHQVLSQYISYPDNDPGRYRRHSAVESGGSFRYPAPGEIPGLMTGFMDWLNRGRGRSLDPIVRAVAAHFLLVSIHPFGDGNGRTARAVECYLLFQARINVTGFYSLANFYYQNRNEYVNRLNQVRFESDPDIGPFIDFALEGLIAELEEVRRTLIDKVRISAFRDYAIDRLRIAGRLGTSPGKRQLSFLLELGSGTVAFADLLGGHHPLALIHRHVGSRTLRRDLRELEDMDLIVVESGIVRAQLEIMDQFTAWPEPFG
ncbi:MAG: Fic family protein [Chloroflexota bacterium]|nr:Fic family protein [Chloroflexota bacterium]